MTKANTLTRGRMLNLVRYASHNADVATSKRDAAIREVHRAGASLREIATESGIWHVSVNRIIDRTD